MHYVYILHSDKDQKNYTGYTENLKRRLEEHTVGRVKSTHNRRPLKLVYTETFSSKKEALEREKFLKSGQGRDILKKILNLN